MTMEATQTPRLSACARRAICSLGVSSRSSTWLATEAFPNEVLLKRALANIRDGDILMAHLGIWSRKDPFAPMLDPLIRGLKAQGFCFAPLPAR